MANGIRQINFYPTISYLQRSQVFVSFAVSILGRIVFVLSLCPFSSPSPLPYSVICSSAVPERRHSLADLLSLDGTGLRVLRYREWARPSSHRLHTSPCFSQLGPGILFYFCLMFCFYFVFVFESHFCADYLQMFFFCFVFLSLCFSVPTTFSIFFVAYRDREGLRLGWLAKRNYKLVRWQVALLSFCD